MALNDEINQCSQHFLIHDQTIKNHSESLIEINKSLAGLPERLENIISQIEKLCRTIERTEDKYVSKEVFELEKKDLSDKVSNLYKGVGVMALSVFSYFMAHLFGKI